MKKTNYLVLDVILIFLVVIILEEYKISDKHQDIVRNFNFNPNNICTFVPQSTIMSASKKGDFEAHKVYEGVPYSSVHCLSRDIYYNYTIETVLSMFNNPYSKIYSYIQPDVSPTSAKLYSGGVCSSYVSWITNQPLLYTTDDMLKMLNFKNIINLNDIEVGDVLICHKKMGDTDNHVLIISDIITEKNIVEYIEISEQWKPLFRKVLYSAEEFRGLLDGRTRKGCKYKIGRFDDQQIRFINHLKINKDIITEYGDNTYFEYGDDVYLKSIKNVITIEDPDGVKQKIDIFQFPKKNNTNMRNIHTVLNKVGKWKLYGVNNEISCITIIKKGSAYLHNDMVYINGYEACNPCGYQVIVLRKDGVGYYDSHDSGYSASGLPIYSKNDPRYKNTIKEDTTEFMINTRDIDRKKYAGYYVRIFYDTKCGQAYKDTNIQMF